MHRIFATTPVIVPIQARKRRFEVVRPLGESDFGGRRTVHDHGAGSFHLNGVRSRIEVADYAP